MISMTDARERVARGAAHLDVVRPGWFNRIDIGTLTLHDPCGCIVGQLYGKHFSAGVVKLFGTNNGAEWGVDLKCEEIHYASPTKRTHRVLQDAWIEAIADRRLSTASNGTPACDAVPVRPTAQVAVSSR